MRLHVKTCGTEVSTQLATPSCLPCLAQGTHRDAGQTRLIAHAVAKGGNTINQYSVCRTACACSSLLVFITEAPTTELFIFLAQLSLSRSLQSFDPPIRHYRLQNLCPDLVTTRATLMRAFALLDDGLPCACSPILHRRRLAGRSPASKHVGGRACVWAGRHASLPPLACLPAFACLPHACR